MLNVESLKPYYILGLSENFKSKAKCRKSLAIPHGRQANSSNEQKISNLKLYGYHVSAPLRIVSAAMSQPSSMAK